MENTLRDIKPLISQSDYSLFLLAATVVFGLLLAFLLFRRVYAHTIKGCKINCEKYYFYKFSSINWENPKEASYLATRYGLILAKDRRRKELFLQLRENLDQYKYAKKKQKVDQDTLNYYNLYKQVCDESL
ncbi:MAG TPA: hypothetical protein ENK87_01035 [Nitratifractor sp.]|jgi:hypothetical protein|nr:hypothetical protein [Nitratifractor sp.]HHD74379.1 hypothetical protein [Nitratifractor sp.]HHH20486.1 hypothetical protein [Nitratifractor sp.]